MAAPGAPKRGRKAGVVVNAAPAPAPAAAVGDDDSSLQLFVLATAAATAAATALLRGEPLSSRSESAMNVDFAPREVRKEMTMTKKERDDERLDAGRDKDVSLFFPYLPLFVCLVAVCKSTRAQKHL